MEISDWLQRLLAGGKFRNEENVHSASSDTAKKEGSSWCVQGDSKRHAGDIPGALDCYRLALKADANCGFAHLNLGGLLNTPGQYQDLELSLEHSRKATLLFEQSPDKEALAIAFANCGASLRQLGAVGMAGIEWRAALFVSPTNKKYRDNVLSTLGPVLTVVLPPPDVVDEANAAIQAARHADCIRICERAFVAGINFEMLWLLWYPYFHSGQRCRAIACLFLYLETKLGIYHRDEARRILSELIGCKEDEMEKQMLHLDGKGALGRDAGVEQSKPMKTAYEAAMERANTTPPVKVEERNGTGHPHDTQQPGEVPLCELCHSREMVRGDFPAKLSFRQRQKIPRGTGNSFTEGSAKIWMCNPCAKEAETAARALKLSNWTQWAIGGGTIAAIVTIMGILSNHVGIPEIWLCGAIVTMIIGAPGLHALRNCNRHWRANHKRIIGALASHPKIESTYLALVSQAREALSTGGSVDRCQLRLTLPNLDFDLLSLWIRD